MKSAGKKRIVRISVIAVFVMMIAVLSVVCLSGCGEIRYDHYVLTTSDNGDGTLTITACTVVKDKDVVIPAEYKGKKIVALGDGEKSVFGGCEFSTLRVEAGVKVISDNACKDWSPLTTLELNEGLERIGANAFSGCVALKDITVPKSVTSIGEGAFEDTAWYKDQPNSKIIYVGSFLYEYKGNMPAGTEVNDIRPETKYISDYAFSGCLGLKAVTLPDNLEKIGASAFSGCTSLESIVIPAKVTAVGERAFEGCTLLENVTIPSGVGTIAPYMFYDCCGLTDVTVADGITAVGESAFENCVNLPTITFPTTVKEIGENAFKNCVKLAGVVATDIETYGAGAFDNCIKLSSADFGKTQTIGSGAFDNCVELTEINLPATVKEIGSGAFNNCIKLGKVTVNRNPEKADLSLGEGAFTNCFGLTGVYTNDVGAWCAIRFSDAAANPLFQAGKLYVGSEEQELTTLIVPQTVTAIGAYAFVNAGIEKIVVPQDLLSIGEGAFKGCLMLSKEGVHIENIDRWCAVSFGDAEANPLYYGEKLYVGDTFVSEATLTSAAKKISAYAFYNCTTLKKITIPSSVVEVGAYAFSGCANLEKITADFGEQPESWDADWNDFCGTDVTGGTVMEFVGEKVVKLDTNTIMAIVVGGILVVAALILLCVWLIKKIKKKIKGNTATGGEQKEETSPAEDKDAETK